jgi:uncharacterized protein with von Willebrand factor type A (vWA) domain
MKWVPWSDFITRNDNIRNQLKVKISNRMVEEQREKWYACMGCIEKRIETAKEKVEDQCEMYLIFLA